MSFFGKIKSAVMGNPVTREYELGRQVGSAGPGLMWKVYQATKKSTRQEMSVFMFNKQTPDFEKLHKKQREMILEMLRRGPHHLIRLRHPRLLTIDHPLEESNDCLAFATEPVTVGLANILGNYDNLPSPLPLTIKEYEVHPIEIQYGLFNLSEALEFLHSGVKLMHGNITPEVVVVTGGGVWKLMGFNFSCYSQYQNETTTRFQFQEWDTKRPHNTNPSLDFLAPEYILTKSCNEKSDVFSFGMLCYAVYNGGRPLCSSLDNVLSFRQNVETISRVTESGLGEVPRGLRTLVRTMLAVEPSVRPDAMEISKHAFFDEVGVATLRYLDTLYEKGDMERSQYFKKNLALVITKLPKRVVHQRVIPALRDEFRNSKMVPFILPIILLVAEDCTMQEYGDVIMPVLVPALKMQNPIQVPLILLQKMDLLLKKTSPEDFRMHILPTIIASLETTNSQLQELCISLIPSFATTVDYSSMKHSIIPRLTALMISSDSITLRIKCLVAVGKMLDSLDKHIVHDHILPLLQQIPSREPGVLMAILGIYHAVMRNKKIGMDKVLLATRIIPFLVPLTVEPTLNVAQFNQFMVVIREMLQCVETEQQTHLEQLSQMEEQTKSTVEFAREVSEAKAMEDTINKFEETFGSGSHDSHVIQKRGSGTPKSPPFGGGTTTNDGYDVFPGLFPEQPSTMATTTSSSSHSPHIIPKSTSPQTPPSLNKTSGVSASKPAGLMSQTGTSIGGMGMGTSQGKPIQQSQTNASFGGMGMGASQGKPIQQSQTNASFGGMGMGASQGKPIQQSQTNASFGGMGMGASQGKPIQQSQTNASFGGMEMGASQGKPIQQLQTNASFGGMGMGKPIQQSQTNASYGGMGMGASQGKQIQQSQSFGGMGMGAALQPSQFGTSMSGGVGMGVSGMGMGPSQSGGTPDLLSGSTMNQQQPLQPVTVQKPHSGSNTWSRNSGTGFQNTASHQPLNPQPINPLPTEGGLFGGMQVHSNSEAPMGLMGNISQPAQSANWVSQNPIPNQQTLQQNVAPSGNWIPQNQQMMMAPMQAQSSNWTMPLHHQPFAPSGNWTAQNQGVAAPTAASLMMGGPLLTPGNYNNQQAPPPVAQQPNKSGNPFADLSFIE